jgi:hypothetical protein
MLTRPLKNCPFCNAAAKLVSTDVTDINVSWSVWRVGCTNIACLTLGPIGGQSASGARIAAEKWNERSVVTPA